VYCVWQVVKTPIIISNNPVLFVWMCVGDISRYVTLGQVKMGAILQNTGLPKWEHVDTTRHLISSYSTILHRIQWHTSTSVSEQPCCSIFSAESRATTSRKTLRTCKHQRCQTPASHCHLSLICQTEYGQA